jgi:hypothetical protein
MVTRDGRWAKLSPLLASGHYKVTLQCELTILGHVDADGISR